MAIPDVGGKSIAELISLKDQNAVVTGGARGIGLAICERFAEGGVITNLASTAGYQGGKEGPYHERLASRLRRHPQL